MNCSGRAWRKSHAVREAALMRLRPVLMTSVATVCGHFPLTLVTGAGAAARNSIGIVLVGGMSIGTIFTLFIVPSLYVLLARTHHENAPGRRSRAGRSAGARAGSGIRRGLTTLSSLTFSPATAGELARTSGPSVNFSKPARAARAP